MNTETLAVGEVMKKVSRTGRLVPFLNANDKEPVWDGYVAVYRTAKEPHAKDDLLMRVPVQIKGQTGKTDEPEIKYPVELVDLRAYPKDNPTVFFVVRMDEAENETVYYRAFTKEQAEEIVQKKDGQETVSLPFQRFPSTTEGKEKLFLDLAGGVAEAIMLDTSAPALLSDTDIYLYNAGVVGFFGRDDEIKQLNDFLTAPGIFRWWGVIAPGGAGKSRLGFEWGRQVRKKGWTVRFLKAGDYEHLDTLTEKNSGPLLLIADYARQHAKELGKWMETLWDGEREEPLRLLLLERDEGMDAAGETPWEKELYLAGNEGHLRRARHDRLLRLPKLKDGPLLELVVSFAAALRGRDRSLPELMEDEAKTLLGRLDGIDTKLCRPLYAMILTDAFLHDPAAHWTQEELLGRLVLREGEQLRNAVRALQPQDARIDETLYQAALSLRRLATALGPSGDRELGKPLELNPELKETFRESAKLYRIPSPEELLLYLGLLRYEDGRTIVPALRPDLLGEYALLRWLTDGRTRPDEKAAFYAAALQDEDLRTFFQRLYADYAPLLNAAPERWERLLPAGLALDGDRAALYADLLYDGFSRCTDRAQRGRLLEKTQRLADSIGEETPTAGRIYNKLGMIFRHLKAYFRRCTDRAQRGRLLEKTQRLADPIREETPTAGRIYNDLGLIFYYLGDYTRALEYHQKDLAICEKVLGPEHPSAATSYNNVGSVYQDMGDYPRALEHHKKALAIKEKVFGPERPSTATSYNNVGSVYKAMGDYTRALEYQKKALAISEKVLGPEHPDTATSYNNVGAVYKAMGDYPRALDYYQKALAIREKVLGPEHPDTATSYNNVGSVYDDMGDYPRALEYHQKALAIKEKVFGPEHPSTAASYNNVGLVYKAMGDHTHALEYHQKALAICEKVLGPEHRSTATSYNNVGSVYRATGDYPRALEHLKKALAIKEKVFGPEHPSTATSHHNMATLYVGTGDYRTALEHEAKATPVFEALLGPEHPYTQDSRQFQASLFLLAAIMEANGGSLPPDIEKPIHPPKDPSPKGAEDDSP